MGQACAKGPQGPNRSNPEIRVKYQQESTFNGSKKEPVIVDMDAEPLEPKAEPFLQPPEPERPSSPRTPSRRGSRGALNLAQQNLSATMPPLASVPGHSRLPFASVPLTRHTKSSTDLPDVMGDEGFLSDPSVYEVPIAAPTRPDPTRSKGARAGGSRKKRGSDTNASVGGEDLGADRSRMRKHLRRALADLSHVRLVWCDLAGLRRCRVVPVKRFRSHTMPFGLGLAQANISLASWTDFIPPGCGFTAQGEVRIVPDCHSVPIKKLPWFPRHGIAMADLHTVPDGAAWGLCPRSVLKRVLAKLLTQLGMAVRVGTELEFVLLRRVMGDREFEPITHSMYCSSVAVNAAAPVLEDIADALNALGIPYEQLHAESAAGQFEVAIGHLPALEAADAVLLAKEAIQAVAITHGLVATFLPKYLESGAGSGAHMHLSIYRRSTNLFPVSAEIESAGQSRTTQSSCGLLPSPLFTPKSGVQPSSYCRTGSSSSDTSASGSDDGGDVNGKGRPARDPLGERGHFKFGKRKVKGPEGEDEFEGWPDNYDAGHGHGYGISSVAEQFVAGLLAHLPSLLAIIAPCCNSYARFVPSHWAGAYACWGVGNREAALRLHSSNGRDINNVECKSVDGCANPHLALAALVAAGMRGIAQDLSLPPPVDGDPASLTDAEREELGIARLPLTLRAAVAAFQADVGLREELGEELCTAIDAIRKAEIEAFEHKSHAEQVKAFIERY
eukprot:jgi/Mesvir1/22586/Mv05007-RA.1